MYRNPKKTLKRGEENQILNAVMLRKASFTIEEKRANGETIMTQREKRIKRGIRTEMKQLRTPDTSQYDFLVRDTLLDQII